MEKNELKPAAVFEMFARINKVPRPSKREEKMIAFLKDFGESLGLETKVDETGNVLIRKPASAGMEQKPTVILQSHMDMVCEKNNDVDCNFDTDGIQTYIDGEWLKAKGTTLGADDGIGCAMEMAILADNSLKHGPLECALLLLQELGGVVALLVEQQVVVGAELVLAHQAVDFDVGDFEACAILLDRSYFFGFCFSFFVVAGVQRNHGAECKKIDFLH